MPVIFAIVACLSVMTSWGQPVVPPKNFSILTVDAEPSMQLLRYNYSIKPTLALGGEFMHFDRGNGQYQYTYTANADWRAYRWNSRDWQANVYLGAGAGGAHGNFDGGSPVGRGLFQADIESRRWMLMASSHALVSPEFSHTVNMLHAGIAPYLAEYDQLGTWLTFKVQYVTEFKNEIELVPMIRLMKGNYFLEFGVSLKGEPQVDFRVIF
ncbi:hypothetical protein QQ056_10290 [Oscillatoria laete-virens NRMC-F 0139]|nr:hypothetical protein [Oscillatoria laete-virens]MDL5053933.1 hypothetical protein [Oscillatoria laete-virens NRMC-F 0139]